MQIPGLGLRLPAGFELALFSLCFFMVPWVLVAPASSWAGWVPGHLARLDKINADPTLPVPRDTTTKYVGHPAIKLVHILPSAAWSLCGAFQLLPDSRTRFPKAHRWTGRAFFALGALLMVGYAEIERRGLAAEGMKTHAGTIVRATAPWFVLTGSLAWNAARKRRFDTHRRWVLRHLSAGLWVSLQRVVVLGLIGAARAFNIVSDDERRERTFALTAASAAVALVAACEAHLASGTPKADRKTA
ncbi:hypothetical protein DFJ74DRAFT_763086 [Hyaloraphidium curvatum]|nr:hypothetical protein DFJ74DRAFT_763086 [Hyaloraphidium curvatum]